MTPTRPATYGRHGADQPRTVTYYGQRPPAVDPRSIPTGAGRAPVDVRRLTGGRLPAGFDWAPRRPVLTVVRVGDPTAPGPDEILARAALIRAIAGTGAVA